MLIPAASLQGCVDVLEPRRLVADPIVGAFPLAASSRPTLALCPTLQKNRVSRLFGARSSVTVAVVLTFHFLRTDSQRFSSPSSPTTFFHHGARSRFYKFEIKRDDEMYINQI